MDTLPKLPKEFVDVTLVHSTGRTWSIPSGGDFQDALDQAQLGDEIVLEAGAVYKGPFTLPKKKQGSGWITVRSSAVGHDFPSPGSRVNPSHAAKMPKLVSSRYGVIIAHKGAHHFRFIGIEVRPAENTFLRDLVMLGDNTDQSIEELPHHIILDRCFVHGDPLKGSRRGLAMNGRSLAVIDSYFSDFKEVGQDSQAVAGWAGAGRSKWSITSWREPGKTFSLVGQIPRFAISYHPTSKFEGITLANRFPGNQASRSMTAATGR
ncbi:MAG TPA: hypothetical protein VLL06_01695 [Nitrospiraceae bacterium]|nr:hypothetical protein [Nitrospiraceae bacterium]